jgi:hypothetical protein
MSLPTRLKQVETKNQEVLKAWSTRGSYFWTEQEQTPFCNYGAIPLRLAFPQKLS